MNVFEIRNATVFNSPLEVGLRSLYLLNQLESKSTDLQRLVYYDYLLLHSSDIPNGPMSLHPNIPHRTTEILVKRDALQQGLLLMKSKELVEIVFNKNGIEYKASQLTQPFLNFFVSQYSKSLKTLSQWVIGTFSDYSDQRLSDFIRNNLDVWGGEFTNEALIRGSHD